MSYSGGEAYAAPESSIPAPRIAIGGCRRSRARSTVVRTTAPPPSPAMHTSRRWNGVASIGDARTSSTVYGPFPDITASGFFEPLLRIVAATVASCSGVVAKRWMCPWATSAKSGMTYAPHTSVNSMKSSAPLTVCPRPNLPARPPPTTATSHRPALMAAAAFMTPRAPAASSRPSLTQLNGPPRTLGPRRGLARASSGARPVRRDTVHVVGLEPGVGDGPEHALLSEVERGPVRQGPGLLGGVDSDDGDVTQRHRPPPPVAPRATPDAC